MDFRTWYSFNTGLNDTVTVDLVAGSATDLGMAVYDACGGAELFCTDDTSAPIEVEVDGDRPAHPGGQRSGPRDAGTFTMRERRCTPGGM